MALLQCTQCTGLTNDQSGTCSLCGAPIILKRSDAAHRAFLDANLGVPGTGTMAASTQAEPDSDAASLSSGAAGRALRARRRDTSTWAGLVVAIAVFALAWLAWPDRDPSGHLPDLLPAHDPR